MSEAYTPYLNLPLYYNSRDKRRNGYEIPFNYILTVELDKSSTVLDFKKGIERMLSIVPEGKHMNWVIGNQDKPRVGSRFGPQRIDGILMLALTLPGIAITYYVSQTKKSHALKW